MFRKLIQSLFGLRSGKLALHLRNDLIAKLKLVAEGASIVSAVKKTAGQSIYLYMPDTFGGKNLVDQEILCSVLQGNLEYVINGKVSGTTFLDGDSCIIISINSYKTYENKRRFNRYNVNYSGHTTIIGDDTIIPINVSDISMGGAFLHIKDPRITLHEGQEIMVYFEAEQRHPCFKSKIITLKVSGNGIYLGIEFLDESEYNKDLLNEIILILENEFTSFSFSS